MNQNRAVRVMAAREEESLAAMNGEEEEHDSRERFLLRYFLQEWKLVKSLLDDIVANGRVIDPSSVQKIRSIVRLLLSLLTSSSCVIPIFKTFLCVVL